jgi:nucleoside-diphosphate-sugar epimerase
MKVFVTGSSGHFAAALLPRLCARPDVEQVTGVDVVPPRFQHSRFSATVADIRDARLEKLLAGHDALVHLAGVAVGGAMPEAEMFDINVNGGHKVFHSARRAGVKRCIYLSGAAVYGSGVHLSEAAPLKPSPQLPFARHHAHLEQLLSIEFPECVRLRPHFVLGPNARSALQRLFRLPFYVSMREPHPLLQCVHEDDAARAVVLALEREVRGPFNLAIEDNFNLREIAKRRHRLAMPVPAFAASGGLRLARRWCGWDGDPAWLEELTRTLLVNCRRAAVELGWRSTHDAASVLAQI